MTWRGFAVPVSVMKLGKLSGWWLAGLLVAATWARAELTTAWVLERGDFQETIVSVNREERDQLVKGGWVVDGTGQVHMKSTAGSGPLHRLARATEKGADRMLETDVRQLPVLEKAGFTNEGIVGFVADADGPGRVAVIQFSKGERRLWVVSEAAQQKALAAGWTRQGIHFWLWPAAAK